MGLDVAKKTNKALDGWTPPKLESDIPYGDMPGDKIQIEQNHVSKANIIFPLLVSAIAKTNQADKFVVSVCGGSGVGKSEIASILSFYFRSIGMGAYTLSGDNYPYRIPVYNDAERVRIFRSAGLRALVDANLYNDSVKNSLMTLWNLDMDADNTQAEQFPWLKIYQTSGRRALKQYLGTDKEQNYQELNRIIHQFHEGADKIWLKRMGRSEDQRWYEAVDFSHVSVLIIEWTHGNSDYLSEVDIPVLLNSTPEETRAHRRSRCRDGKTDSPFTTMVLEIEQEELAECAHKAKIIISKAGEKLTYQQYCIDMGIVQ